MTDFIFQYYSDYEDGRMARLETVGEEAGGVPVNIFIDNASEHETLRKGPCVVDVSGVGNDFEIFASEEEYNAKGCFMASVAMIPMGVFSSDPENKSFEESPHILFSGKVTGVEYNDPAPEDQPNCCLTIETYGLTFDYYIRYGERVAPGSIVHGVAWLFGDIQ